ncbi:MAG: hypothetical protein IKW74_04390 [Thermoguttaceae bacterium]|nr:hypothetical protein [Thermoguttaceae bacterium]
MFQQVFKGFFQDVINGKSVRSVSVAITGLIVTLFECCCTPLALAESQPCDLWGTPTEQTTYSEPYCPYKAPDIPVITLNRDSQTKPIKLAEPNSPETALIVVNSNGSRYSYYYKRVVRYQDKIEDCWVWGPTDECPFGEWHWETRTTREAVPVKLRIITPLPPDPTFQPPQKDPNSTSVQMKTTVTQ